MNIWQWFALISFSSCTEVMHACAESQWQEKNKITGEPPIKVHNANYNQYLSID